MNVVSTDLRSLGTATAPPGAVRFASCPHLKPLTSVRFFAAFLVVIYHAWNTFPGAALLHWPEAASHVVKSGYVGVSLFFILSGFILAYNYLSTDLRGLAARKQFWVSRLARVYPIYLLGLVIAAPKFFISLSHGGMAGLVKGLALTGLPVMALVQSWVPGLTMAWNPPGWSLSAEAFFYAVFPFVAIQVQSWRGARPAVIAIACCWLLALLPPALALAFAPETAGWTNFIRFNPLLRLPEFLLGVCLGKLFLENAGEIKAWATRGTPLAIAALALILCWSHRLPKNLLHNGLLDPLLAVVLLGLAQMTLHRHPLATVLSARPVVLLGEASYALYILHAPMQILLVTGASLVFPDILRQPWGASALLLIHLGAVLGASLLAFRFVEVPARSWLKRALLRPTSGSASVVADSRARNTGRPAIPETATVAP